MRRITRGVFAGLVGALFLLAPLAMAGAIVAGARVDLISETQGAKTAAVVTNVTGDYVIPNLAPDTYTLEVSAPAFKVTRRMGVAITGGLQTPQAKTYSSIYGYSVGGPVYIPKIINGSKASRSQILGTS
jgi:hypothetical protein